MIKTFNVWLLSKFPSFTTFQLQATVFTLTSTHTCRHLSSTEAWPLGLPCFLAVPLIARHPRNRLLNRKVSTLLIAKKLRCKSNMSSRARTKSNRNVKMRKVEDKGNEVRMGASKRVHYRERGTCTNRRKTGNTVVGVDRLGAVGSGL